jgi:DNA invertase Pin-like site-specific DNA recombinase
MIRQHCATAGLPTPKILDEPPGTSGRSTDFRNRPQGRWLLLNTKAGDVLVATKLDRLGRSAKDILGMLERFASRGVRVIVIRFLGGQNIDMDSTVGQLTPSPPCPSARCSRSWGMCGDAAVPATDKQPSRATAS